jgi:hypothetical protein
MGEHLSLKEDFSFWKNLVLVAIFFTMTPLALGTSLFSLLSLSRTQKVESNIVAENLSFISSPQSGVKVFASLPTNLPSVSGVVNSSDARVLLIQQYLSSYNSPLEPYAGYLVSAADTYGLDFRLLTAIAQKESNLCKVIPPESYNCWGWGIHSKGTLGFSSFQEGIDTVSKGLREEYLDKGFETVEDIMSKYTPLSNGSWAEGVNKFMTEMQ